MHALAWTLASSIPVLTIGAIYATRDDRKNKQLHQRMNEQQHEAAQQRAPKVQ